MTNKTKELLQAISEELGRIHIKWLLFCQLYKDEEIVDLLNESAPTFFGACQSIFLDDIILSINRLTDPSKTYGKENLALASILDVFEFPSEDLKTDLQISLKIIKDNCSFIKKHRDRRISHSDLETYFQIHPEPLPAITKEKIENVLLDLRTFVNKLELHLFKNEISYEHLSIVDGASNLVGCLNDAKLYRDQLN